MYASDVAKVSNLTSSCKGFGSVGLNYHSLINERLRACIEAIVTWHLVSSLRILLMQQNYKLLDVYGKFIASYLLKSCVQINLLLNGLEFGTKCFK